MVSRLRPLTFFIRMFAIRSLMIGVGMLIARGAFNTQYWLWAYVSMSFLDAILALFFPIENQLRLLAPLWGGAILLLFFVGMAYGLDIAGILNREEEEGEDQLEVSSGQESVGEVGDSLSTDASQSPAEEIKIIYESDSTDDHGN